VLATGVGAPIALSLVYMLVARWAGLSAAGVAMPGHFLVRLHGRRPVLVEPCRGGRTITKSDCMRHLRHVGRRPVAPLLRDLDDREVLRAYLDALRSAACQRPIEHAAQSLEHADAGAGAALPRCRHCTPCTCSIQRGSAGRCWRKRMRLDCTAPGSSPTWVPRLKLSKGAALTP
jgi:hypothetical protein